MWQSWPCEWEDTFERESQCNERSRAESLQRWVWDSENHQKFDLLNSHAIHTRDEKWRSSKRRASTMNGNYFRVNSPFNFMFKALLTTRQESSLVVISHFISLSRSSPFNAKYKKKFRWPRQRELVRLGDVWKWMKSHSRRHTQQGVRAVMRKKLSSCEIFNVFFFHGLFNRIQNVHRRAPNANSLNSNYYRSSHSSS